MCFIFSLFLNSPVRIVDCLATVLKFNPLAPTKLFRHRLIVSRIISLFPVCAVIIDLGWDCELDNKVSIRSSNYSLSQPKKI